MRATALIRGQFMGAPSEFSRGIFRQTEASAAGVSALSLGLMAITYSMKLATSSMKLATSRGPRRTHAAGAVAEAARAPRR